MFESQDNFRFRIADRGQLELLLIGSFSIDQFSFTSPPTNVLDSQWHHVAVVAAVDGLFLSLDGEIIFTSDTPVGSLTFTGKRFILGRTESFPIDKYEKWMDEFRLWKTARSIESIQATMNRKLRSNELTNNLVIYYDFDSGLGDIGLAVTNRVGDNKVPLFLGLENIGSLTFERPVYLRSAPLFVTSDAPIYESAFYVSLTRYFGMPEPNYQLVRLPHDGSKNYNATIISLPYKDIILLLTNGIQLNSSMLPYTMEGNEIIISMANNEVLPLETEFTYKMVTETSETGIGTVFIILKEQQPPSPGGPGHSLQCNGKSLPIFFSQIHLK